MDFDEIHFLECFKKKGKERQTSFFPRSHEVSQLRQYKSSGLKKKKLQSHAEANSTSCCKTTLGESLKGRHPVAVLSLTHATRPDSRRSFSVPPFAHRRQQCSTERDPYLVSAP